MEKRIGIIGCGPTAIDCLIKIIECEKIFENPENGTLAEKISRIRIEVFEQEEQCGGAILKYWPHVTLFSSWKLNVSQRGIDMLSQFRPALFAELSPLLSSSDLIFPTGSEFVRLYLAP